MEKVLCCKELRKATVGRNAFNPKDSLWVYLRVVSAHPAGLTPHGTRVRISGLRIAAPEPAWGEVETIYNGSGDRGTEARAASAPCLVLPGQPNQLQPFQG